MVTLFLLFSFVIMISYFLTVGRFLNSLIVLENFNVLILLFCLLFSSLDGHIIFIVLMVVSTVEIIISLTVLTRVWECSYFLELVDF
uniref:NADH dehydrogenase subunit 4L n=3 Tax=Echinococcus TaxID=6209 RepID=A0A2Z4GPV5_9CEST|nr:NADH dehydrogenase subunit 4L [Echinococcus canadensis]YP_009505038.1 NADH dehydrogenase subunit 4L [Echinococcus granulosus sensu lato genotype G6]YP_009505050.1 NADH dehydrogenase subunit 4L [Echinococcus granulosus sensu lato genotype G7]AUG32902.1 NADH dehydrogenase subunit 4L [Echinococcus canadensis]AWW03409.1 NADH dehydrogenase subunit 4L [Echinococcus granulosus sensu lato genotype G6]AWW03421.1 NADH dehydrogenase subunit 4L [Echinococcus granulosus sensu lato genotype G6]AWW03433.